MFDPDDIAKEFVNYFRTIFLSSSTNNDRPSLDTTLPQDTNDFTYSIPDKHEIWKILKGVKKNASPGPDGFNGLFLKKCWPIISVDFIRLVHEFHAGTAHLENLNDAFITLIPKK